MVVCNAPVGEIGRNLATMKGMVREAVAGGAAIVCFPELNVTGYCNRGKLSSCYQRIPGRATDDILQLAALENAVILFGMAETDGTGNRFASHVVASPDGSLGVYRKLHIAPPERVTFTPGSSVPLFEAKGVRFGIQLCYDAHFPELSTLMAAEGADLIFIPHASPRGAAAEKHKSWMRHLPARAYDNSVFIAACNQIGENGCGLSFPGNAVVLAPSGNIIGTHLTDRQGILFADLKAEVLDRVREHEMRYFFPNRRPELY
jgi:N-carbamoylputrescine amidase